MPSSKGLHPGTLASPRSSSRAVAQWVGRVVAANFDRSANAFSIRRHLPIRNRVLQFLKFQNGPWTSERRQVEAARSYSFRLNRNLNAAGTRPRTSVVSRSSAPAIARPCTCGARFASSYPCTRLAPQHALRSVLCCSLWHNPSPWVA